ncbi:kinesin motor domain-containing protein [Colletotrichum paranaense]|uniref:Kinesin motor domain-containing protein n=1 Tax=Colletotrichum paranaense TaxID=1914294 RepID=A0ABQ9T016_9PEZI|nr:kinesin motor domain-containing protein [Colletotrichum paranaense]KAK1545112.1 kinesin motor domain-containing protein [Colletotrichum paranaense]
MDEYHIKHTSWYQASVEAFSAKVAKKDLAAAQDPNTTSNPDMIVAARLRPILEDEVYAGLIRGVFPRPNNNGAVDIHQIRKHIKPLGPPTLTTTSVQLDKAYGPDDTSEQIYRDLVEPLVPWAWSGGVSTVFAYGQTGSGKTFTVSEIEQLVAKSLMSGGLEGERKVYACIIELAGNSSFDLLNSRKPISVLEDSFGVTQLAGALEHEITEAAALLELIEKAATFRRTASTFKNDASSRSHAICRIRIESPIPTAEDGLLYLIDLAGSEAARDIANHTPDRMKEAREINTSLSVLKDCIRGRATVDVASLMGKTKSPTYIPFRQSSLTKILKHVFDPVGRRSCKTVVLACVNPSLPDAGAGKNTLKYAEMLRVLLPKAKAQSYDPETPATWDNERLKTWIDANSGNPAISGELVAPTETGSLLLRLPAPEFLARCLKSPGVDEDQARAFHAKFWRLHIDSQKSGGKKTESKSEAEPAKGKGRKTAMNQEMLSSSVDPDAKANDVPFKERIRPGMVVRWSPPSTFPMGLPGLNMLVILCPQLAVGPTVRDLTGDLVNRSGFTSTRGTKYLCAMVLPGFMAESYELSMWRQVVVDVEQMEAEVLLEYDSGTRYYHITL